MTRNVTLRIEETVLKRCRYAAVESDMSLSQWIAVQIGRIVSHKNRFEAARKEAVKHLQKGYHLGGKAIKRDELHER